MAYDILEIEAKRQTAVDGIAALLASIPYDSDNHLLDLREDGIEALERLNGIFRTTPNYTVALKDALASQASLSHPNDSPEPSPWSSPEYRSKRFILKACGLWSDEYQEPMVTDPRTWSQINLAADLIGKYLTNPKYGSALTPDLFLKYFASTTDSPLRPQYIPERFNDFLSWCRAKGYIA